LFTPDPAHRAPYDRAYGIYRELYDRLQTLFPRLTAPS
jgi:sugar (pentulose or hexulose) kinase